MPRRRFARAAAAGLLAAFCAVPIPAAAVDGFLYSREVQVPTPGWVRVPLDLAAAQHMAPGGADLHVFAPGGGEVALRLASGPPLPPSIATPRGAGCASTVGALDCSFPLPAPGQVVRRLTVDLQGGGAVGYRLYEPRAGTWRLLREGTWQRSANRTQHSLDGSRDAVEGSRLRLELFGTAPLRLAGWAVELEMQAVLFQAGEAGLYTLAYGGAVRKNHRLEEPAGETDVASMAAGPETRQTGLALPETVTPGAPLGKARFESAWTVVAPTAKPGDLVRLELPDVVYANARRDLGDLRIALSRRQIPFFRWSPPEPAVAGGERGAHPRAAHAAAGESEAEVALPALGLPLTELVLSTPGGPLRRRVALRYLEPVRTLRRLPDDPLGDSRERPPVTRTTWQCDPEPPLPCRETLELPGAAPKLLSVRFEDGDNPPLGSLDIAVWRRRDVLLFLWPGTGGSGAGKDDAVKLLAGSERLTAPSYDFAALGAALLTRPWQPAELDLTGTAALKPSRWARWALPLALALACLFLLFLLRKILAER
ncbi:MAG TPA: hypothetical protein VH988_21395 [Thermoanaerobaculia bacterium]|jgi:hypothetical protein|nr:hypothetical protein [Thermoanaerobaculia bacterium]